MRYLSAMLFLVFACSAYLYAATDEQTLHQSYELNKTGSVAVKNVNGDVTIRVWDKNEVDLKATKRGHSEDFDLVEISIDSKPDRFTVESKYPHFRNNLDVAVDYELTVPRSAVLEDISNVNGGVDITGVEGEIGVSTVNGSVDIDGSRSSVKAESVNGSVHAKWAQFPQKGDIVMQTVNGRLQLTLPKDVNADLEAKSMNGSIHSDFPITVHNGFLSHRLEGQIGKGGVSITLKTLNGSINIMQY
jgi:DUF4097 and DUF4098 domain-containing protein YvlB